MSYKYRLKGARWLRLYTAAARSPAYAAQSDAQTIADTLCDVPWTRAKSDGPAMFPLTSAKALDENPANRDLFDAALFCAEHADGAHRAYANAAMYLFELPAAAQGKTLESVKVHVESDAYNALGARIAVHLLSSAELPTDCATVRTGAAHAEGVAARRTVERDGRNYWYSNWDDKTITGGTSESPAAIGELKQYLAVFVGMENYATSRNEWLEGASYIRNLIEIETDAVVTGWTAGGTYDCSDAGPAVLLSGGSSPTWLQPLPTVNVDETAPVIPASAEQEVTHFTPAVVASTPKEATVTLTGSCGYFEYTATISLYGDNAVGGTITCTLDDPNTSQTKTETVDLSGVATGSGPYLSYVSSAAVRMQGPHDATCFCLAVKVPTFSLLEEASGTYHVAFAQVKRFTYTSDAFFPSPSDITASAYTNSTHGVSNYAVGSVGKTAQLFDTSTIYWMLRTTMAGVPTDMDACRSQNAADRLNLNPPFATSSSASPWSVTVGGHAFVVAVAGRAVTLTESSSQRSWDFTLPESSVGQAYFDPSVRIHLPGEDANDAVSDYGLASVVGDFSHAVATFEAGTQPPNAEVLGRLCRMSRKSAQGMMYLHPATAALADELDVLRPVPRFFRVDGTLPSQTACQPGLSVWYYRPNHATEDTPPATVIDPSEAEAAFAYRDGTTSVVKVTNPVFLQMTVLALRAPSAFSTRLVLANKVDANDASDDVTNHFKLRFVAWVSPADQWDGSNAFAMAAMASMPSVYRSDGEASVSWQVDCSGSLIPLGVRTMTARRIGVSEVVAANIAAGGHIDIPLDARVGEGDVVLIAPEVLGFNAGTDDDPASACFGRQDDPAGTGENSAESHNYAWARYPENLGWFPKVTGE